MEPQLRGGGYWNVALMAALYSKTLFYPLFVHLSYLIGPGGFSLARLCQVSGRCNLLCHCMSAEDNREEWDLQTSFVYDSLLFPYPSEMLSVSLSLSFSLSSYFSCFFGPPRVGDGQVWEKAYTISAPDVITVFCAPSLARDQWESNHALNTNEEDEEGTTSSAKLFSRKHIQSMPKMLPKRKKNGGTAVMETWQPGIAHSEKCNQTSMQERTERDKKIAVKELRLCPTSSNSFSFCGYLH